MPRRSLLSLLVAPAVLLVMLLAPAQTVASAGMPTARQVRSIPTVGAVFLPSVLGSARLTGQPHYCTGSVVHSPGHDLVLTVAHCMVGTGVGYEFVPGYHDGQAPYGVWSVVRTYLNPAWIVSQDPQHDYAFLQVAPLNGRNIEDLTGANRLGDAPAAGRKVTVDGYLVGVNDRPITCRNRVYETDGYPSFDCAGFADGTSGGPWLAGHSVVGVIGGLHQGGCTPSTSYTSAFGADTRIDWQRAIAGGLGDLAPVPGSDGCP